MYLLISSKEEHNIGVLKTENPVEIERKLKKCLKEHFDADVTILTITTDKQSQPYGAVAKVILFYNDEPTEEAININQTWLY